MYIVAHRTNGKWFFHLYGEDDTTQRQLGRSMELALKHYREMKESDLYEKVAFFTLTVPR